MTYLKRILSLILLCTWCVSASAQQDSCDLRVTLLTCGPGEELYSVFGHSALRVTDRVNKTDVIFNYGTFDFNDPDFYVKFVRGKLLYYVSVENFSSFVYAYKLENRFIIEQQLNLRCEEKQRLYQALRVNAREENKFYMYEFLFDNCSSRLRDIVAQNTKDSVSFGRIIPHPAPTFRNMLHEYLFRGNQNWSAFGIDLLLGSQIDRKMKNEEAMFLPDYLMKGFDSARVQNRPLVRDKQVILPAQEIGNDGFRVTPMMVTIVLLLIGTALVFFKSPRLITFANVFDGMLFFTLGLMGCLMLFMWYGTDHELCSDNYNLYWALPAHIIVAFLLSRNLAWVKKYLIITTILCAVFILSWPFLPQGMNSAFFPLVLLSGIRSFDRVRKK